METQFWLGVFLAACTYNGFILFLLFHLSKHPCEYSGVILDSDMHCLNSWRGCSVSLQYSKIISGFLLQPITSLFEPTIQQNGRVGCPQSTVAGRWISNMSVFLFDLCKSYGCSDHSSSATRATIWSHLLVHLVHRHLGQGTTVLHICDRCESPHVLLQ